jgi:hypothetical protein
MSDSYQHLLVQLKSLLNHKKSKSYYAERLGVTEREIGYLLKKIKEAEQLYNESMETVVKIEENLSEGLGEIIFNSPNEIKTLEELIEKCKIDTDKWEITKYVQNYWGNEKSPYWQVKAWLSKKKDEQLFQDRFISFLQDYKPSSQKSAPPKGKERSQGCLVINKQDAHYNKYDVHGNNSIEERFNDVFNKLSIIVKQATLSSFLDRIVYILGSDQFNSEFTGTTTKGTPQQDIEDYHSSFEKICSHEMRVIDHLLHYAEFVDVVYVSGNHDEYVGWHMVNWLDVFYRNEQRISFDRSPNYRKYVTYADTAMMFNHGDVIKPVKLASLFPMEFKHGWSKHNHFYIFTGDKHHELSQDFNGIKFYQIPAFSNAKSKWDEKNGYTCSKGEVTAFLIERENGMTNIFKQHL